MDAWDTGLILSQAKFAILHHISDYGDICFQKNKPSLFDCMVTLMHSNTEVQTIYEYQ